MSVALIPGIVPAIGSVAFALQNNVPVTAVLPFCALRADDRRGRAARRWYALPAFGPDMYFLSGGATECGRITLSPPGHGRSKNEPANPLAATLTDAIRGACPNGTLPVCRL